MKKLTIRLTEEQNETLSIKAKNMGYSKNTYVLKMLENNLEILAEQIEIEKEILEEYKKLAYQIRRFGNNINEINKNFYQNKNVKISEINEELEKIWRYIKL